MDIGMLKSCIGSLAKNVFFCGANEDDQNVTIYAKDDKTRIRLIEILHKGKSDPAFKSIKIDTTRSLKLNKTRSLEEILNRVPHQNIYLDPTATIERSNILVSIAKQARQLLGPVLKGCYFNSEKRNVYFFVQAKDSALDLAAVQKQLEPIITHNTQRLSQPFYYTITISLQKPQGSVIAVDKASVLDESLKGLMKSLINKLKWPVLLASASSLGLVAAKAESSLPAVSNPNGWLGAAGDYLRNQRTNGGGAIVEGGIAVPITHALGAQLHTYDGVAGNASLISIDGYVFWRNPAQGLLGPHVTYTKANSYHHTLYGLHGEGYLNQLTLVAEAGGVGGNQGSNSSHNFYGEAIIHWYALPDWRVYAGAIVVEGNAAGQIGTEYQFGLTSLPGLSIFADAGIGAHNLNYGFLGLRYYFGDVNEPNKPLIRRQREDMVIPTLDPINPKVTPRPRISHI